MIFDAEINQPKGKGTASPALEAPFLARHRETGPLWVAFGLLVVALAAVSIYSYRELRREHISLNQLPAALNSAALLSGRVDALQSRMQGWAGQWDSLTARVAKIERESRSTLGRARKHTDEVAANLTKRIDDQQAKMDANAYLVNHRLEKMESSQQAEHETLARLQNDVASARQQVAATPSPNSGQDYTSLEKQVAQNVSDVHAIQQRLKRQRVEFEAPDRRTYQLAEGIALHVTHTDTRHQRFKGWIRLVPDGRTLWVSNWGAEQPVIFYRQAGDAPCELVVTRVTPNAVTGFVLLPGGGNLITSEALADLPTAQRMGR
ncbi:MAG: hypothetical protein LAP13_00010 [Acidobacteriia bacterium]|nr:hypothetical protein [Terriglobia bacterium]